MATMTLADAIAGVNARRLANQAGLNSHEAEERAARERAEAQAKQHETRVKRAHIPARYVNATITVAELDGWLEHPGTGVFLAGNTGVGKTWNACALAMAYMDKYAATGRFISAQALCDLGFSDKEALEGLKTKGIVVIDDLGRQGKNEYACSWLFDLIDSRYAQMRPTIITSNYYGKRLPIRLANIGADEEMVSALLSRFRDYTSLLLQGEDQRGQR